MCFFVSVHTFFLPTFDFETHMNFDEWLRNARQSISKRDAGMCVGSSIDDDRARAIRSSRMNAIDESTLVIRLECIEAEAELVALIFSFALDIL